MQGITPYLWFDNQAEEAASFYVSLFAARPGADSGRGPSGIVNVSRYGEAGPGTPGTAMTVSFQLEGQEFAALNGGQQFQFTEAISLLVNCESQEEVDYFWDALLSDGGKEDQCGWLKDRYGLSWQIIPTVLEELLTDPDPEKSQRVMKAMLEMVKIDIDGLNRAAESA